MTATTRAVDALNTNTPTVDPIRTLLRGALLVTETAATHGLPTPTLITIDRDTVQLVMPDETALNAWSIWLGTELHVDPIGEDDGEDDRLVYHSARAVVFEVPVVLQWLDLGVTR